MLTVAANKRAVEFIRMKAAVSRENFGRLPEQIRIRAFTTAAVEDVRVMGRILGILEKMPAGADWRQVQREVAREMVWGGGDTEMKAARARAKFVVGLAGRQAYAAARWAEMREVAEDFPYWRYVSSGDDKVRASHAALDGVVLRADDPFWETHFPPWDFGCRCTVVVLTEEEAEEMGVSDRRKLDWRPAEGYRFNPADVNMDPDVMMTEYGEEEWGRFADAMRGMNVDVRGKTRDAWEWWYEGVVVAKDGRELERFAKEQRREAAVIRDAGSGMVVERLEGDEHSVRSARRVYDRMEKEGRMVQGMHVHPEGGPYPSAGDVLMALHWASGGEWITGGGMVVKIGAPNKREVLRRRVARWRDDLDTGRKSIAEWQRWFNTVSGNGTFEYREEY